MTTITRTRAVKQLEAAIAAYKGDTGPGHWQVDADCDDRRPMVGLTYIAPQWIDGERPEDGDVEKLTMKNGDEPWKNWGGEAILALAGVETCDGHCDSYIDRYGDEVSSETGMIEVSE